MPTYSYVLTYLLLAVANYFILYRLVEKSILEYKYKRQSERWEASDTLDLVGCSIACALLWPAIWIVVLGYQLGKAVGSRIHRKRVEKYNEYFECKLLSDYKDHVDEYIWKKFYSEDVQAKLKLIQNHTKASSLPVLPSQSATFNWNKKLIKEYATNCKMPIEKDATSPPPTEEVAEPGDFEF